MPFLRIEYEDLVANPAASLAEVTKFLGLSEPLIANPGEFRIERQSNSTNAEWRRLTIEANRAKRFPQPDDQIFWIQGAPFKTLLLETRARGMAFVRKVVNRPARVRRALS